MLTHIPVKRARPSVLACALSFLLTALMILCAYLAARDSARTTAPTLFSERVTREMRLDGGEAYMLSFGAFDDAFSARLTAARALSMGAAGYLHASGIRTYVFAAAYFDAETAEGVRERIIKETGARAEVTGIAFDGAVLNVTAAKEQADALKSVYDELVSAESRLYEIACAMEEGVLKPGAARAAVMDIAAALRARADTYQGHLGKNPDENALKLYTLARNAQTRLARLSVGETAYFPAAVRHAQIACFLNRRAYLFEIGQ